MIMSSLTTTPTSTTTSSPLKFANIRPSYRVSCRSGSFPSSDLNFCLHDALQSAGINTGHAREAREGFISQIKKLSDIERETSITINRCVDLAKTALYIASEDDSLISHSSVPLPVDSFIERLDDLSMGYCSNYSSAFRSSPETFLDSLERFLYVNKGFRRSNVRNEAEPRALYLHSVLTHRSGTPVMLSLIYSEILKMLRLWGLLDFDCELFFPHDLHGLPRGYKKQKSKESDQPHIMTSENLLVEVVATACFKPDLVELIECNLRILTNLKEAFWPFQHDNTKSIFMRAADAANFFDISNTVEESGYQLASAKAAQHRLDRGVWTSVPLGDMRRALSACERIILLEADPKELRDYGALLYHCGLYEQSLKYLTLYQAAKQTHSLNKFKALEEEAVERLIIRLKLISMEEGWSRPSYVRKFLNSSEPW